MSKEQIRRAELLTAVEQLQSDYPQVGEAFDLEDVKLSSPWQAISLGGDQCKLIAIAPELGIAVKRYLNPALAKLVYEAYEAIRDTISETNFPLLMPLGLEGDTLIFPYFETTAIKNEERRDEILNLALILTDPVIPLKLHLAHRLNMLFLVDSKQLIYSDPFDDSIIALQEALK
ncbi:hypothetical protein KKD62_00405 [Patescibacteria group bacterium]|nr:hypothetical protein [Patescibacteria group bacterium]MBU1931745.1 hypothetical protein [Patescibacteria group bacterium]